MFAVMDHLFSYELYQYLCGIEGVSVDIEESVGQSKNTKVECEEWIPIKGNMLFKAIKLERHSEIERV